MRPLSVTALALIAVSLLACGGDGGAEDASRASGGGREPAREVAPPPRRKLPNAAKAPPATLGLDPLERVDLAAALTAGEVSIEANDTHVQASIGVLVDRDLESMAISNAINPLELTLTLKRSIRLRAARVYPAAAPYDWVLEPVPGEGRLIAEAVPERAWSQIDLEAPVETSVVRLELLRLERDDYVHLNEIELYAEPRSR